MKEEVLLLLWAIALHRLTVAHLLVECAAIVAVREATPVTTLVITLVGAAVTLEAMEATLKAAMSP
jgi:ABC-type transporter Mla maintaining outer membrane lipid asymmetry permease subunit MlaE